ncbi:hypothetical protein [Gaopeijia maritima]|uniref:Uncharacterized protein n=1 Tax=Gaopeijia maritima TaxID=3119007 RepID=A0ABU9E4J7_9BACT
MKTRTVAGAVDPESIARWENEGGDIRQRAIPGLNTRVEYLYRDAANGRSFGAVVFRGSATPEQLRRLRAALISSDLLFADQVGLASLAPWRRGEAVYDENLDHEYHELVWPPRATTVEPIAPVTTIQAFLRRVERRARDNWGQGVSSEVIPW